jgi:UDP-glucose:(heptosyl)LPS alpha-1,3-glucosyltransferase
MRIGIAIEWFDPTHGGAERSTAQIALHLAQRGHDVTILAGSAPGGVESPGIAVRRFSGRKVRSGAGAVLYRRWAQRELFGEGFDTSLSVTTAVPARLVQPRAGVLRESLARGLAAGPGHWRAPRRLGQVLSPRRRALLALEAATFADPRVHRFVAISRSMGRQMRIRYGVPESRIALVLNGADIEPLGAEERARLRDRMRLRLGWEPRRRVVLFCAHDARRKGLAPLLRALAALRADLPDIRLAVAGEWPGWGARLARSVGVASCVDPLGVVADMRAVYCAADLVALPSYYDPASRVVIESLVLGTPVVTSSQNGAADWIEAAGDPRAGRIVADPDDTAGLAAAMGELLRGDPPPGPVLDPAEAGMARHARELERLLLEAAGMST